MKGFPKIINTRQDIYNLLPLYPVETKGFVARLLDEHKSWQNGQYIPDPAAGLFKLGMTVDECLAIVDGYVSPPTPAPPPTPEEVAQKELDDWRKSATVSKRQAKQQLLIAGLLSMVQPAIDAIADATEQAMVQIYWDDSQEFERQHPQLIALATGALGLDDEQLDALFLAASAL